LKKALNAMVKAARFMVQIRMVIVVVVKAWCPTCEFVPSWCAWWSKRHHTHSV